MENNQYRRQQDRLMGDGYAAALQRAEKDMPSVTTFGATDIGVITQQEIADLYRDPIGARVVNSLPESAAAAFRSGGIEFVFNRGVTKADQKKLKESFESIPWVYGEEKGIGLISAFDKARKEALLQGDAWLLWDKKESRLKILPWGKIRFDKAPDHAFRMIGIPYPVHLKTPGTSWGNRNLSILQRVADAIFSYRGMVRSVNKMMTNPSVFLHGMSGLADISGTQDRGWVYRRLSEFNQSLSIFQTALYDRDFEQISEVSHNLSQIPEIWDRYENAIVTAAGMPRFIVLGSPGAAGLASGSAAETQRWVEMVNEEMAGWLPPLKWVLGQVGLTSGYEVKIYPQTPLTSTERAKERLLDLTADEKEYNFRKQAFGEAIANEWLKKQYPD